MNNNRWENWLQISSTLAVLVGVVLVVIQLRQNAELLELQILKQDAESYVETDLGLLPEDVYQIRQKSLDEPENLTLYEYQVLDVFYWSTGVVRWRSLYELSERGLLDDAAWQRMVWEDASWLLANPFGRAYWERIKAISGLPGPLVEFVDTTLADSEDNFIDDSFKDVKKHLEAAR